MAAYPIPLDNLITYVEAQHPNGDELVHLTDAVVAGARLNDEADALIGHFVDRARRTGASWSQIGASMGVTKQAAQKRFVPRADGTDVADGRLFSRFTQRSCNAIVAARNSAEGSPIGAGHIVAGVLSEPEGLAAKIVEAAGVSVAGVGEAVGVSARKTDGADAAALRAVDYGDSAKEVLRATMRAVLRLGHNYVGTEHLLLGTLMAEGETARTLRSLGLTVEVVERGIAEQTARIKAERRS